MPRHCKLNGIKSSLALQLLHLPLQASILHLPPVFSNTLWSKHLGERHSQALPGQDERWSLFSPSSDPMCVSGQIMHRHTNSEAAQAAPGQNDLVAREYIVWLLWSLGEWRRRCAHGTGRALAQTCCPPSLPAQLLQTYWNKLYSSCEISETFLSLLDTFC